MKLNINKDKILKHKFWVLLLVAAPLILAGQFIVLVLVAGEIDADKKKLFGVIEEAKKNNGPFFSDENAKKKLAQADELQKEEYKVWAKVFENQADTIFWPKNIETNYPIYSGKFLRELKYLDGAAAPVPDDEHHLTGKLVDVAANYLEVQLKDSKKTEKLYRVANEDMKLDGGKSFFDLTRGKDAQFTFQTGWYFNDKLTQTPQWNEYATAYASQIRPILDIVDPVNEEGEGVVQLKDWYVPKNRSELPPQGVRFLRFVTPPWKTDEDISEEAWMAQEDLWIGKEIYRNIRQANDFVGKFEGKGGPGMNKISTFKNPYFEMSLKLVAADKAEISIKNLQSHRQKLEMWFKVRFTSDPSVPDERIKIEGEPLDPNGQKKDTYTFVRDLDTGLTRTGVFSVEQILNWETAAVRRIDAISIGSMAPDEIALNHRIYPDNVEPLVPKKEEPAPTGDATAPTGGTGPAIVPPGPGFRQSGGPGFGRGPMGFGMAPVAADLTNNGLTKNRYSEKPTEQTRRLPVAVALIVDQDHIDRVLTAFSNSKHRFVLTQLLINRYPLSVRPNVNQDPLNPQAGPMIFPGRGGPGFGPPIRPGGGPGFGPAFRQGGGPGFGPAIRPGPGPGFGGPAGSQGSPTGEEEIEANVELVLYGTVTLYQRYPARKLPKATETAPEAPK